MKHALPKPLYSLLAAALLAAIVMPIAFAGDSSGAQPPASASIAKQLKKLKKRIAALEGRQTPQQPAIPAALPPNGPAGGDLTGSFPNPLLGPNTVGEVEIVDNGVDSEEIEQGGIRTADIAIDAITSEGLAANSVLGEHIGDGSVLSADIATAAVTPVDIAQSAVRAEHIEPGAVGSSELKALDTVTSAGVTVNLGTPQNVKASCPPGQRIIGGGYAWLQDEANSIIVNAPSEGDPNQSWEVRGMVEAGSNVLYAWANCLAV